MKIVIIAAIAAILAHTSYACAQGVYHQGYTTGSGTYVAPHYQSSPDHSYNNNWGVAPNSNPYTGQQGTAQPTYNNRPPPTYGSQSNSIYQR